MEKQTATFGGGCFWCTEAVFEELKGVESVVSGYSGGTMPNPTYEQVCGGKTGHAEVIQIKFNPEIIPYTKLLEVFFIVHDPTTINRQGNDIGEQYRSVIFYSNEDHKKDAEDYIRELTEKKEFSSPIVTKVEPLKDFYSAEKHRQDYYAQNQDKPYCQIIINPKLNKFRQEFQELLKPS